MGEAIITAALGTRLKISQYLAMKENLDHEDDLFLIESIGCETRSGCRIEKIKHKDAGDIWQETLFKDGKYKKLLEEKENLEKWDSIMPGITPRVFSFEKHDDNATLLMEYLNGKNFQEILIGGNKKLVKKSLKESRKQLRPSGMTH
jgi:hypothetical protein